MSVAQDRGAAVDGSPHIPTDRRFSTARQPSVNGRVNVIEWKILSDSTNNITECASAIHLQFREAHEGHKPHAGLDPSRASTGVVWTTERAYEQGFLDDPSKWANLGQGAPEVEDSNTESSLTYCEDY